MREIKFRAWDKTNKKWLLGYDYTNLSGFSLVGECVLMGEFSDLFLPLTRINEIEIMQYTGLQDKNGKEIYDSDILNNKWLVLLDLAYGIYLLDISSGDIIRYKYQEGTSYEITGDTFGCHQKVSENCQGVINKLLSQTNRTM